MVECVAVSGRPELEKCVRVRKFGAAPVIDRHRQQDQRGRDQVPGAWLELAGSG
jgi:hypothetical protein